MITSVGAVGKVDETHASTKPFNDDIRASGAAAAVIQQAPALQPIPAVYVGGYSDVSDFVYTETGHIESKLPTAGSVSVPGIGVVPGLSDQSYVGSPVKYEIKVGGVLVARVHENGVMVAVEGFDYAHMGFPSPEERGLTGSEVADGRTAKFSAYLSGLTLTPEVTGGFGALAVNASGQPATTQVTVLQQQVQPMATPYGTTLQTVVTNVVRAG